LTDVVDKSLKKVGITVSKPVLAAMCVIFGILLIIFPQLVGIIIGVFLLIQGILLLTDYYETRRQQPHYNTTTYPPSPAPETP